MVKRILTHDDVSGACELSDIVPYPEVTSLDASIGITATLAADGSTDFDLSIPTATTISCNVISDEYTNGTWVSDFVDQGIEYSNADVVGFTNTCRNISVGSFDATLTGNSAGSYSARGVDVSGAYSSATATRDDTITGQLSFVAASRGNTVVSSNSATIASGAITIDTTGNYNVAIASQTSSISGESGEKAIIASRGSGTTEFPRATVISSVDSINDHYTSSMIGTERSNMVGTTGAKLNVMLASSEVQIDDTDTGICRVTGGWAAPGTGAASANRTWDINSVSGNMRLQGSLTTTFAFPGFGEKAIVDEKLPEGSMVVFEGATGLRLAKKGERPDGVTTKELAICAGGGYDPENSPWEIDEYGNRVFETIEIDVSADGEDPQLEKVTRPVKNAKYDPTMKLEVECVEMLGRQFANCVNKAKVGDYIGADGEVVDASLGFRVLEKTNATIAVVLVK